LPVPGVSVVIKGTRIGTSTAVDGSFALRAKEGDMLAISGIGVKSTEQPVTGADITINVVANARELNQVVVTATGIKKEAKRLGYAIQTIDAATLTTARSRSLFFPRTLCLRDQWGRRGGYDAVLRVGRRTRGGVLAPSRPLAPPRAPSRPS